MKTRDEIIDSLREALKDCMRAWAKGESTGDFGAHPAIVQAKAAITDSEVKRKTRVKFEFNVPTGIKAPVANEDLTKRRLVCNELFAALEQAAKHLEYCNYGDKWERECAIAAKLKEQIDSALTKVQGSGL